MYKFNGGRGGVICDVCRKLIDQDISLDEYEKTWEKQGDDGDICMACKVPKGKSKVLGKKEGCDNG